MVKLYIDDVRNPPDDTWVLVRTVEEAQDHVRVFGMPTIMSLDHDLGGDATVMQFLHWLTDNYFDNGPPTFVVHSANPIGRDNMISYLESWRKALTL